MHMAALPTLLPLPEAARKYGISQARLKAMIEHGKIKAAMIMGELVVSESEIRSESDLRKEDLPEYKKHAYLKGVPIWISEAARKYNVLQPTITNWVKAGIITRLGIDGNKVLIDEADVAYCAEIYHQRRGQGKRVFNEKGLPYKPRTGPLVA